MSYALKRHNPELSLQYIIHLNKKSDYGNKDFK